MKKVFSSIWIRGEKKARSDYRKQVRKNYGFDIGNLESKNNLARESSKISDTRLKPNKNNFKKEKLK